jgi:hypothetical protein
MRSTKELIAELDAESIRHRRVVLVVRFESSIIVIDSGIGNRTMVAFALMSLGRSHVRC